MSSTGCCSNKRASLSKIFGVKAGLIMLKLSESMAFWGLQ